MTTIAGFSSSGTVNDRTLGDKGLFVKDRRIIRLFTTFSTANPRGTFQRINSDGTISGYRPATGRDFVCYMIRAYHRASGVSAPVFLGTGDNDIGQRSASTPTNEVLYFSLWTNAETIGLKFTRTRFFTLRGSTNKYLHAQCGSLAASTEAHTELIGFERDANTGAILGS